MIISETVRVAAEPPVVYGAFADLDRWVRILPDVLDVEVFYFDGYNQEFSMTVERPGGPETVRGVRYHRPFRELELVQTTPPPGLSRMCGTWRFSDDGGSTVVTATREFTLAGDRHAALGEEGFASVLRTALRTNLALFRKALETDGTH
jgi:polyketide cyclase/dehydrase/lipid transport protein